MTQPLRPDRLTADKAAAASPQGLIDRRELALIAVERTLMPMVVTDPRQSGNPIVLANNAFLTMTGYSADEVIGRNCRFMQGSDTDAAAVAEIRKAIATERACIVELLNYRKNGTTFINQLHLSPIHDDDGLLLYFFGSQADVTAQHRALDLEAAEHALLREIDHRAKNVLALVQGIVRLSNADDAATYAAAVQGRIDTLAGAHALLADGRWRPVMLDRLVQMVTKPYGLRRVALDGPPLAIGASQVQPLALVLHEIMSNAARFGGLSATAGAMSIAWRNGGGTASLHTAETGGPPPATVRKSGFGLTMIEAIVRRQLRGEVDYDWAPAGLECRISLPTTQYQAANR